MVNNILSIRFNLKCIQLKLTYALKALSHIWLGTHNTRWFLINKQDLTININAYYLIAMHILSWYYRNT